MIEIKRVREIEEDSYTYISYVMLCDGAQVGSADVLADGSSAYCERIDIDEANRRKGYGTSFLRALSSEHGGIVVAPDNEDAKRLYERLGDEITDSGDFWAYDQGYGVYKI